MFISYKHQENSYCLFVNWTHADGISIVFRDVTRKAAERHYFTPDEYMEIAEQLDALTDKLYSQVFSFTNEYHSIPYDPRFRKRILQSLSELDISVQSYAATYRKEHEALLAGLYASITDKLRETVDVYLKDHAYRSKYRERMRDHEQYIETTPPAQLSCEFEDVLIQMTEISRQMDCLSETQRRRFVKHIFLKYTMQEIALSEKTTKQAVQKSVATAMRKLKELLSD